MPRLSKETTHKRDCLIHPTGPHFTRLSLATRKMRTQDKIRSTINEEITSSPDKGGQEGEKVETMNMKTLFRKSFAQTCKPTRRGRKYDIGERELQEYCLRGGE